MDTNHAEIGGLVGQHWQLPARVVSGITHHHTPSQGDDLVCDVVHVANEIAKRVSDDDAPVAGQSPICEASLERLGLSDTDVEQSSEAVRSRLGEVLAAYA